MKIIIIAMVLGVLLIFTPLTGQTIGVYGAANLNATRESSDHIIHSKLLSPSISFSLGGYYQFAHTGNKGFMSIINYARLSNKNQEIPIQGEFGELINTMEAHINNHYISLSGLGVMYFGEYYIGVGITGRVLLFSNTKMGKFEDSYNYYTGNQYKDYLEKEKFANRYYAPLTLSLPFLIGYSTNRLDIFARIDVGLTNRLKGDNFVKEYNNTIEIGFGYRLLNP